MAKYQVETEKGSFTLNGSTAAALASALLVKLNNQRANGYKINGNYGDNMFSVVLVDKDKKPFKEYYLKKVGKTQDSQSPKLWQIDIQNKKTKRTARTFFCFAENGSEANNKAKKALKMLGEGYELAWAPHHIATKGDGQAEQYLKSNIKVIDKSPLFFMDSFVFFIKFARGGGSHNTAAIQAKTESEAINKFKKTKWGNYKIIEIRKTGKAPVMGGEQKLPKIGDSVAFMDSVVKAFRDDTPKITLQMIKKLIGSNKNQIGGAETDSISVGDWEISGNKEKHFSKWNYYYEAENTKTGAHKRSGDASEILQFIKSRS